MSTQKQVRAAFDFDAQPGSGELSIRENEILTVLKEGIEGGWMEGKNSKGQHGLFPESYVTKLLPSSLPPTTAPPPLPPVMPPMYSAPPANDPPLPLPARITSLTASNGTKHFDPWDNPSVPPAYSIPTANTPHTAQSLPPPPPVFGTSMGASAAQSQAHDDDFDDDWSDDDEELPDCSGRGSSTEDRLKTAATATSSMVNGKRQKSRSRSHSHATSDSHTELSTDEDAFNETVRKFPTTDAKEEDKVVGEKVNMAGKIAHEEELAAKRNSSVAKESTSTAVQRMTVSRSRSTGPDAVSVSGKPGAVRMKTINRFSNFVKTGMESYILAQIKMTTPSAEKHQVILAGNLVEWAAPRDFYQCIIDKPKKESKLKGLKSFIAYSLTSSLTGIQVSRRYKHFDWLSEQLQNKYLLVAIPPLPEKQVSGRYEEDLIEHRKCVFQLWANIICRHPVLSHSEVWKHFITCTDMKKWKTGKRQAEKDEYVGGNFFNSVAVPSQPIDIGKAENQIETFSKCMRSLDDSVKMMFERVNENQKRMIGPYKSNWQKMAAAFNLFGQSFDMDQTPSSSGVKNAIKESANVLHKIGSQHEENGKREMEQLLDWLYVYKGICANIPEMLNVHKSAFSKLRDNERLQAEGKLSPTEADAIRQRVDVVTYALLAEINHLNQERNDDFRQCLGNYFQQQAQFYNSIGQQLGNLAEQFKKS